MRQQLKLWDSKRARENLTCPNTLLAIHRTKGLSNSREELTGRLVHPLLEAGGRGEGKGQTWPQRCHLVPNCKQAPSFSPKIS